MDQSIGKSRFEKSFTQQEPIPEAAIERAVEVMRSGRLHRYNVAAGEEPEAALLERDYAAWQGADYCLACASGGYAIHIALRSVDVKRGDPVLSNAYTLAPVPGAIHNAGAIPVLVETDEAYHIDIDDLRTRARSSGARVLVLSHMRGHICDMDAVSALCQEFGITLIEDCAHTMGARWKGIRSGKFGNVACFSTQTYKHINSGEGGLLTTNDPDIAARAIIHSGSYMLYQRHGAAPDEEAFARCKLETPNYSGRMDNLRAAILRGQLARLEENIGRWNALYSELDRGLRATPGISLPQRAQHEAYVGSSIQFRTDGLSGDALPELVSRCGERGIDLKWFGADQPSGFTSRYDSWRYMPAVPDLPKTKAVLSNTFDMRVPLTFDLQDCRLITQIIGEEIDGLGG